MQNEMGQSPKIVMCPSDDRNPNTNFYEPQANLPTLPSTWPTPTSYGSFDNTNVSYWVGVGALDTQPQALLGGDRNLGSVGGSSTAPTQDGNYGFSGTTAAPTSHTTSGADMVICTNGTIVSGATGDGGTVTAGNYVGWSAKLHSAGNTAGAGNIMLGDGSVQQCTSASFRLNYLKNAVDNGLFDTGSAATSAAGDIHLVFP